jgi:hypothetical protein
MACAREQGPSNGKSGQVFSFFLFFLTPNQVKFFPFSFFLTPNQVKLDPQMLPKKITVANRRSKTVAC